MPIPSLSHDGVLPPFLGAEPHIPGAMAPYRCTLAEVVATYATSPKRNAILNGLLSYRAALRELGFVHGFQWIDGSFVEDCEAFRGRSPDDVDIITFAARPRDRRDDNAFRELLEGYPHVFDPGIAKDTYMCDAYVVDLTGHPLLLVDQTRYWFGLFSHQRETFLWKGMLEIPFTPDDDEAYRLLNGEGADAAQD